MMLTLTWKQRPSSFSLQQAIKPCPTSLADEGNQSSSSHATKVPKQPLHERPNTGSTGSTGPASESSVISIDEDQFATRDYYAGTLGDYHILPAILGSGHYGCVRECIHRVTRQPFAVKSIEKSRIGRLDHLRREVSLLRAVNHPGIMKMVDYYEDSDYVHIVTEKYTGGELFDKIIENKTENGCFSEKEAARIIKSLLEAVKYLHEKNIVHRDIKPENIMFESKQEGSAVKLIDFGLSRKHRQGEALMRNPVGTAYYMSPELLQGKYDRSCDVWAVGVVAYILLCGYPPFNGVTDSDIVDSINKCYFDFPEEHWGRMSSASKHFIESLLRKDPSKRQSAGEALNHPWISMSLEEKKEESGNSSSMSPSCEVINMEFLKIEGKIPTMKKQSIISNAYSKMIQVKSFIKKNHL